MTLQAPEELAPAEHRGSLTMKDRVVEKIARGAVDDVDSVGGHVRRVLGLTMGDAEGDPKIDIDMSGDTVVISMSMAVRWPESVRAATAEARERVVDRVESLTGKTVGHVDITVPALVTPSGPDRVVR